MERVGCAPAGGENPHPDPLPEEREKVTADETTLS